MAASTLAGLGTAGLNASAVERAGARNREYYELRVYRLKAGANHELLDAYVEKAAIPALNRLRFKPVGVFTEIDPKDGPALYVLRTYPSLEVFAQATAPHITSVKNSSIRSTLNANAGGSPVC